MRFQEDREVVQLAKGVSALNFQFVLFDHNSQILLQYHHVCNSPLKVLLPETLNDRRLLQPTRQGHHSLPRWLLFLREYGNLEDIFQDIYIPLNCEVVLVTPGPLASFLFTENPPINNIKKVKGTIHLKGFFGNVWKMLLQTLNITVKYVVPREGKWGNPTEQGWDGMMGMVVRDEANLSACAVTMISSRAEAVEFSIPLFTSQFRFFIRKRVERAEVQLNDYLSPFSRGLWVALLFTTLVAAALMVFQYRVMHHIDVHREESLHVSDAILFVFSVIFCQQAPASRGQQLSLRFMQVSIYLAGLIAMSSYSGTLISSLTVFTPRLPFTDLEGLNRSSFSLGVGNNSIALHSFRVAKKGVMADLYNRYLVGGTNVASISGKGFVRVCRENHAFIATSEALDMKKVECEVTSLPQSFMKGSMGLIFPRGSPYRGVFSYMLLRMIENGVLPHLHKVTWYPPTSPLKTTLKSIDYTDIRPLLSLLLLGILLSLALLFCEVCRPPGTDSRAGAAGPRRRRQVNVRSRRAGIPPDRKILFQ